MAAIITDGNIHNYVRDYVENRRFYLPVSIRNIPIGDWNVSHVRDMRGLFENLNTFNEPLNNWNVTGVTNMNGMFSGCTSFNQPLDNWNVSRVTTMNSMFRDCRTFNQDLSNWNVSRVIDMTNIFRGCRNLTINPRWQINPNNSAIAVRSIFLDTPLQGQMLEVAERLQPQPQPAPRPQQLPAGIAFEIHNAFPELNFRKFMDIVKRDNNGASNFKDATYPLQPLITY